MSDVRKTIGFWFQDHGTRMKVGDWVPDYVNSLLAALDRDGFVIVAKEAVPGGASCQSSEHAMPETTPKGEQRD